MDVKLVWTQSGQVLGEVVETTVNGVVLENPVFVSPGPQGLNMMPVLMFSDQTKITLPISETRFNGELFEPIKELRNAYSQQFGSGIQLLTN